MIGQLESDKIDFDTIRWYNLHITEKYRYKIETIRRKTQSIVKGVNESFIAKNRNPQPNKDRN